MKRLSKVKMKKIWFLITRRLNEYLPLLLSILLWYYSGKYIQKHFPFSVSDDVGMIQDVSYKIILFFISVTTAWIGLRLVFPKIGKYIDNHFGNDLDALRLDNKTKKFSIIITVVMFMIYFIGAILIFMQPPQI